MLPQFFNYHTHTFRCGHAVGTDEEYVLSAIKAGYKVLGFSEHIQHRAMRGQLNRIDYENFYEYFHSIRLLATQYASQIQILCGLEVSFIPEWLADIYDIRHNCDYFILGQHVGGKNIWHYNQSCSETDVLHYAEDIEYAVRTGLFSVIAHPDYFMITRNTWTPNCVIAAEKICTAALEYKIPLEINLKGLMEPRRKINEELLHPYPFRCFWEIAAEIGAPVIYGVDAHSPDALQNISLYKQAQKILKNLTLNFQRKYQILLKDRW